MSREVLYLNGFWVEAEKPSADLLCVCVCVCVVCTVPARVLGGVYKELKASAMLKYAT
jgi:hypothetical protein